MASIFTVDVEDWYQTNGLNIEPSSWSSYEDRVYRNTMKVLELLGRFGVSATFFVLGCVAQKHPGLVREIQRAGHEIGSHGGWHQMVNRMSLRQFRDDLRFSIDVLQYITGEPVRYYRAPSWSISPDRYAALSIMEEEGIVCDSSLQPFRTPLSGNKGVPVHPFRPVVDGRRLNLLEIPSTVLKWGGATIPFSGGFYLRFWPSWFSSWALRHVHSTRVGMIYIHPWELDPDFPRLKNLPPLIQLAQYYNLRSMEKKVATLLEHYSFTTMGQFIAAHSFPEFELHSLQRSGVPEPGHEGIRP
ncbi:DUF3473 domain-containing protein [Paenibacillus hamazuiensis]|uniref:DUF3473 domain-containing protein n=1 Tax=Paenibacillus hamazuiensis TaxID=2936508 RepID=UPI00200F2EC2|nr:DUF3473 domain-containing protein [Paenibacillus hamazuiensis]